jgi:hypothetical protein
MIKVWPQLLKDSEDADICDRGALMLYDYAVSNPDQFYNKLNEDKTIPKTKWVGRWDRSTTEWTHIDFIKSSMRTICTYERLDFGAVVDGLLTKKLASNVSTRIGDNPTPVFRITRAALEGDQSGSCDICALNNHCEKEPYKWSQLSDICAEFQPRCGER